jgi:hypothetical protein
MNEPVIVDFSRVDAALKLVERERRLGVDREEMRIAKERAEATAKLIAYGAAACALLIVSIGVAVWLSRPRPATIVEQKVLPPTITPPPPPPIVASATEPSGPQPKVVTSYTQFRSIRVGDLRFSNAYFSDLTAGHHYPDNNAARWDHAWCYAMFWKDGLQIKVNLATRNGAANVPDVVTVSERQQLVLTDGDISYLRANCPWKSQ